MVNLKGKKWFELYRQLCLLSKWSAIKLPGVVSGVHLSRSLGYLPSQSANSLLYGLSNRCRPFYLPFGENIVKTPARGIYGQWRRVAARIPAHFTRVHTVSHPDSQYTHFGTWSFKHTRFDRVAQVTEKTLPYTVKDNPFRRINLFHFTIAIVFQVHVL